MATFVLSKYKPEAEDNAAGETPETTKPESKEDGVSKILLKVDGSISEMVARALSELLANKVDVTPLDDTEIDASVNVKEGKALTTESINEDPLRVFESIPKDAIVYIANEGFKTQKEEWFLSNITNKTDKVFYSIKSLANYCVEELNKTNTSLLGDASEEQRVKEWAEQVESSSESGKERGVTTTTSEDDLVENDTAKEMISYFGKNEKEEPSDNEVMDEVDDSIEIPESTEECE